jgi:epoxyqueuosine reductase
VSSDAAWLPRAALDGPTLAALWRRTDAELSALMADSAMSRAGVRNFRRNLAVAIGNSNDPEAVEALNAVDTATAPSLDDPVVLEHVEWARKNHETPSA